MYIMIKDIIGEKRINLSYPIYPRKEIAVVIVLSDNVQYQILKLCAVMGPISDTKS